MQATITIDSSSGTFTHVKGAWRATFPVTDLEKWLAFYLAQQERYPAHADHYAPDVEELGKAIKQVNEAAKQAPAGTLTPAVTTH